MKKDFNEWLETMKKSVATFNYYTDFVKVYKNVKEIERELNLLNSLIGKSDIEKEFLNLVDEYPKVLKAIPILIAKRETEIYVNDPEQDYNFDFLEMNYTPEQYALFMRNSGLFDLLQNHIINNLVDYALGVEVGLDSNGRKNRTGSTMEDIIESYLIKEGLEKGKTYFKQMTYGQLKTKFPQFNFDKYEFGIKGDKGKKFDFVFVGALGDIYACECNFFSSQGTKLSAIAGDFTKLAEQATKIPHFHFIWITDGSGWNSAKNDLKTAYDSVGNLFNLNDLENGALKQFVETSENIKSLLEDI